ncbi:PRC-barrel domain-containing protein [Stappia indica]|uniref:PRC-barrel domain-containing protein n=1 Tax=Stappia indica TaxID=538381 RepID=UPI0008329596|nr:PRC-barrel domain-containing protein [Stappia indica]
MTRYATKTAGVLLTATALSLLPHAALAQQGQGAAPAGQEQQMRQQNQGQNAAGQNAAGQNAAGQNAAGMQANAQVAGQCQERLEQSAERMRQDQFWLTGWGAGYGTRPVGTPTAAPDGAARPGAETPASPTGVRDEPMVGDPRGTVEGAYSPREQIRTLYFAAHILSQRGEQEGCEYVASQLDAVYDDYTSQLTSAGVEPNEVTDWRQEQLALAQPIDQVEGMRSYRIDNLTGTDVRNVEDENLGSVHDVILDPASGTVSYVLVARGGFLGLGEEYVAVPWERLHATPGLETIVLTLSQEELEQAPTIDPDEFRNPQMRQDARGPVDDFWSGMETR